MDRLIYSSLVAMRGAMARQTATANNLANAETTGFKGEISAAESRWLEGSTFGSRAAAGDAVKAADMRGGKVIQTGRALDIAIAGDTLLAVQGEDGRDGYTRRGDLQLADSGLLTTGDGRPVLGSGGPIMLPPADQVLIGEDGRVRIVPTGGDPQQPQEVDRLRLVAPAGSKLFKSLDGLFRTTDDSALPEDPDARVETGKLEGSNVEATQALVSMIEASRSWDMQLKLIGDARDNDAATARLMRIE